MEDVKESTDLLPDEGVPVNLGGDTRVSPFHSLVALGPSDPTSDQCLPPTKTDTREYTDTPEYARGDYGSLIRSTPLSTQGSWNKTLYKNVPFHKGFDAFASGVPRRLRCRSLFLLLLRCLIHKS